MMLTLGFQPFAESTHSEIRVEKSSQDEDVANDEGQDLHQKERSVLCPPTLKDSRKIKHARSEERLTDTERENQLVSPDRRTNHTRMINSLRIVQ